MAYRPPEQSLVGQIIDVFVLLVLTVGSLFVPLYLGLAGATKTPNPSPNPDLGVARAERHRAAAMGGAHYHDGAGHRLLRPGGPAGYLLDTVAQMQGHTGLNQKPFIILTLMFLAWLNYRGVLVTLNFSFIITAVAFIAIIILFFAVEAGVSAIPLDFSAITTEPLPYGWVGVLAALHFGLWYYLGIEGTTQAAEEVRSPPRALPYGTMAGIITLVIAATLTWYVCSGLIPWEYLGQAGTPLFDATRVTGSLSLMILLFIGTIFSTLASANGCINDASRAWFSMGRDRYLPTWFGAVHPVYRTPYRAIVFLVPIALVFALGAPLDQVITFSILSGLLGYTFMSFNMIMFRNK